MTRPPRPSVVLDQTVREDAMARALCAADGAKWDAADFGETLNGELPEQQREHYVWLAKVALSEMTTPNGRWVWVPDTKRITLRDKAKAQAYDRRWQKDNRKTKVAPRAKPLALEG